MKINFNNNSNYGHLLRTLILNWAGEQSDNNPDLLKIVNQIQEDKELNVSLVVNGTEIDMADFFEYTVQVRNEFIAEEAKALLEKTFGESWDRFVNIQWQLNLVIDEIVRKAK